MDQDSLSCVTDDGLLLVGLWDVLRFNQVLWLHHVRIKLTTDNLREAVGMQALKYVYLTIANKDREVGR